MDKIPAQKISSEKAASTIDRANHNTRKLDRLIPIVGSPKYERRIKTSGGNALVRSTKIIIKKLINLILYDRTNDKISPSNIPVKTTDIAI